MGSLAPGSGPGLDEHQMLVNTELTQLLGCCCELGVLEVKGYRGRVYAKHIQVHTGAWPSQTAAPYEVHACSPALQTRLTPGIAGKMNTLTYSCS